MMTKKEKAQMDGLAEELRQAEEDVKVVYALGWSRPMGPLERDIAPPDSSFGYSDEDSEGWDFNDHYLVAFRAWSSTHSHGTFYDSGKRSHASQGSRALFSTKKRALEAMRREMEKAFAKKLRVVDKMIEAENGSV